MSDEERHKVLSDLFGAFEATDNFFWRFWKQVRSLELISNAIGVLDVS